MATALDEMRNLTSSLDSNSSALQQSAEGTAGSMSGGLGILRLSRDGLPAGGAEEVIVQRLREQLRSTDAVVEQLVRTVGHIYEAGLSFATC